ncbi:unnamed protein product [Lasius platythorax]|uniref:Uncharacterized protein n=1 Tax=Lasius platythorax TaxID=488582 RepID=A0AAV2MWK9_9HYME
MTNVTGFNKNNKSKITYADVETVTKPVIANEDPVSKIEDLDRATMRSFRSLSIDKSNDTESASDDNDDDGSESEQSDKDFKLRNRKEMPQIFTQQELNDLIRDLGLPKDGAEYLATTLKRKNLLSKGATAYFYRDREKDFRQYFSHNKKCSLVFCSDVNGLMNALKPDCYRDEEWRLFIDSSVRSLKAVLLHNTNKYASVPIAHSVTMKEEYTNIKMVLKKIKYDEHKWQICGDLKITSMILGQQSGFTKYPCFLCLWDSRDRKNHYRKKVWPERNTMKPGSMNIIKESLINKSKVLLPPLHIKLGLIKQYVKALNQEGDCFRYIEQKFPNISDTKLKEGIFNGPQIRTLLKDVIFVTKMNDVEKEAWLSFKNVVGNFLGNHRSPDYKEVVGKMIENFKELGCLMSLKIHFLDSHLDWFPQNLGDYSKEQGERFHQDIREMERRYQGKWNENMMADYCWTLKKDIPRIGRKRKKRMPLHRTFESKRVRYSR